MRCQLHQLLLWSPQAAPGCLSALRPEPSARTLYHVLVWEIECRAPAPRRAAAKRGQPAPVRWQAVWKKVMELLSSPNSPTIQGVKLESPTAFRRPMRLQGERRRARWWWMTSRYCPRIGTCLVNQAHRLAEYP